MSDQRSSRTSSRGIWSGRSHAAELARRYKTASAALAAGHAGAARPRPAGRRGLASARERAGFVASLRALGLSGARSAAWPRGDRRLHGRTPMCRPDLVRTGGGAARRGRRHRAFAGNWIDLRRPRGYAPGSTAASANIRPATTVYAKRSPGRPGTDTSRPCRRGFTGTCATRNGRASRHSGARCGVAPRRPDRRDSPRRREAGVACRPRRNRPARKLELAQAYRPRTNAMRAAVYRGARDVAVETVSDPPPPRLQRGRRRGHVCIDLWDRRGRVVGRPAPGPAVEAPFSDRACRACRARPRVRRCGCVRRSRRRRTCASGTASFPEPECRAGHAAGAASAGRICASATTRSASTRTAAWQSSSRRRPTSVCAVPDGCDDVAAAIAQPLAVARHALARGGARPGEALAVIGVGGIGSFVIACGVEAGMSPVIAVDVNERRLETARKLGANDVVDARSQSPAAAIRAATDGAGADVVVEASGAADAPATAVAATRRGGRVVLLGLQHAPVELDLLAAHTCRDRAHTEQRSRLRHRPTAGARDARRRQPRSSDHRSRNPAGRGRRGGTPSDRRARSRGEGRRRRPKLTSSRRPRHRDSGGLPLQPALSAGAVGSCHRSNVFQINLTQGPPKARRLRKPGRASVPRVACRAAALLVST